MSTKPQILIVDDTPVNIKSLHDLLRDVYRICVATNGTDALELVKKEAPDLILLDITMPGIDGYEVCRRLKALELTAKIPIIFVTAKTETGDEEQGFKLGAVDYITKPISPPIVKARIKTQLRLADARRHLEDLVTERTNELAESNLKLRWHVKELEGRDKLVQTQLSGAGEEEAYLLIQQVLAEVFGGKVITIYRSIEGQEKLERVTELEEEIDSAAEQLVARAAQKKAPQLDRDLLSAAVPMVYRNELLGLICICGLQPSPDIELQLASLSRMAQEAAMVLRMGQVTDDFIGANVDLDELMNLNN